MTNFRFIITHNHRDIRQDNNILNFYHANGYKKYNMILISKRLMGQKMNTEICVRSYLPEVVF